MVRRTIVTIIAFAFIILLTSFTSYAQEMSFSANGGISKPVGDGSEYWNLGFSVGGNGFYPVSPNISIGGRIAYNKWTPDEDEIIKSVSAIDPGIKWDISGSATIIEIIPSLRVLASPFINQSVNLFGQLGLGLFLFNLESKVKGTYMGSTYDVSIDDSETKVGISIGGGLTIGEKGNAQFEILPLYHIIFTEDESTKYFSVNIGVLF